MEKYILQILENNSRVIVPEFGAFIIKQKNPIIVVFNEFLQYNDGVLVDTVAKNEGTDRDSAKKKIDEFVKSIQSKLDSGNPFVIENLGALVKSATGKISLEKETTGKSGKSIVAKKEDKKPDAKDKETKEDVKPAKEEKKAAEEKSGPVEPKKEVEEKPVELEKEPAKTSKKEEDTPKEKAAEKKAEVKSAEKEPTTAAADDAAKTVKSEPQAKAEAPQKHTVYRTTSTGRVEPRSKRAGIYSPRPARTAERSGKKTNVWLWVIVILVVNGIIITYFIMSDQLNGLFKKTEEISAPEFRDMTTEQEEETTEEMLIIEPEDGSAVVEPVQPPPAAKTLTTGKRYYVVAGVFREEQNADNLVIELRNKGYNAEKFGKIGNLHAVSFGVYKSKTDAEREMQRIKKEVNPEAWIKVMQ